MYKLLGGLKEYFKLQEVQIDNAVFRLHNVFTTVLLLTCSLVITATQYVGNPISCIVSGIPTHVVNTFCWISSTFTMPDAFRRQVRGVKRCYLILEDKTWRLSFNFVTFSFDCHFSFVPLTLIKLNVYPRVSIAIVSVYVLHKASATVECSSSIIIMRSSWIRKKSYCQSLQKRTKMKIYVLFMDSNPASIIIFVFFICFSSLFFRSRCFSEPISGWLRSCSSRCFQRFQRWRWEKLFHSLPIEFLSNS